MPIIEVKGNLLISDCDIIAHGCNCFNNLGGALHIKFKLYFLKRRELTFLKQRWVIETN